LWRERKINSKNRWHERSRRRGILLMIKKRRTKGEGMEWHGREYLRITYGPVVF